jgi:DNA invertase Pin-like site-specific DNA recombinase
LLGPLSTQPGHSRWGPSSTPADENPDHPPPQELYGYARVSTDGQSVDAQGRQLTKAGCKKVFREVASGARTDRPQLRRLLSEITVGDVVVVTRLDRLARSTFDLFSIVKQIVDAKAQFRSLPWADTGTSTGRLMIAVLGGLADVECDLIRTRTAEGRSRAQKRGQPMGRPPKLTDTMRSRPRPDGDGRRVLRLPNSRAAMAWERARFRR